MNANVKSKINFLKKEIEATEQLLKKQKEEEQKLIRSMSNVIYACWISTDVHEYFHKYENPFANEYNEDKENIFGTVGKFESHEHAAQNCLDLCSPCWDDEIFEDDEDEYIINKSIVDSILVY